MLWTYSVITFYATNRTAVIRTDGNGTCQIMNDAGTWTKVNRLDMFTAKRVDQFVDAYMVTGAAKFARGDRCGKCPGGKHDGFTQHRA